MEIENLLQKLHIDSLNEMQSQTIETLSKSDKDVVVLSATGSGKTLAYLLPLVNLLNPSLDEIQTVVLVPGRELALQTYDVFRTMGSSLKAICLYGGRATMDEHRELRKIKPHIVFATPGRINDHIDKGNFSVYNVKYLVIDEFDKCLKMGFRDEMCDVIGKLPNIERRILLSATDANEIPSFVNMGKTARLDFLSDTQIPDRIIIYKVYSPDKDKLETLARLLCDFGDSSTIVFLNFRDSVDRVTDFLYEKGFSVSGFHGGKDQKEREDALYKFRNGSANVLVGTDLASRGLDIPEVDNIIHYHLPIGNDEYIHRVGRTARWQSTGRAFFLLSPDETIPEYVKEKPEEYVISNPVSTTPPQPRMVTLYIGKGKKNKLSKGDILGFLCKKGGLAANEIGRIDVKERCSYVAIARNRWQEVLNRTANEKIKGIKTIIERIR
ncbi:MAG: DEAD/DEAH box helicase [Prevotella sp.]|nr:DEAD/DEAH box helicase [Prevotella sp.]